MHDSPISRQATCWIVSLTSKHINNGCTVSTEHVTQPDYSFLYILVTVFSINLKSEQLNPLSNNTVLFLMLDHYAILWYWLLSFNISFLMHVSVRYSKFQHFTTICLWIMTSFSGTDCCHFDLWPLSLYKCHSIHQWQARLWQSKFALTLYPSNACIVTKQKNIQSLSRYLQYNHIKA